MDELEEIRLRYAQRAGTSAGLYSMVHHDNLVGQYHLERAVMSMLKESGLTRFGELRVLEIGCGSGTNLLRLIRWGFDPVNLVANELLPDRASVARRNLPSAVEVIEGDAREIEGEHRFDIVYQSTVLSSILDDAFQREVADTMWRLTKPGGAVLSYDFAFNNPKNPDVRGVSVDRLAQLFPDAAMLHRRVTLAPPISRRLGRNRMGYALLNSMPLLRTHRAALLRRTS